jgi:hypothetical protein
MFPSNVQQQPRLPPTVLTTIGTPTPAPPTILRVNLTSSAATASYGSDNNWYIDSGATDHITGELDKLTMHNAYNGTDQIHAANGTGMEISHIGTSIIPTPPRNFVLNNVLHAPTASKNLISIQKFTLIMMCLLSFTPFISWSRIEK